MDRTCVSKSVWNLLLPYLAYKKYGNGECGENLWMKRNSKKTRAIRGRLAKEYGN